MNRERFNQITGKYPQLSIAVIGDFCLDRYLEIDPVRAEVSIETGLPVHNVVNIRAQAGAAGTIVNNFGALGIGAIFPVGFCGEDGDGYELLRALANVPRVKKDHFFATPLRRTFTYCKPLVMAPGQPPRELNRLDSKNWTATPSAITDRILESLATLRTTVDAVILMDQVDQPGTGVVTAKLLHALKDFPPTLPVIADSRRGLGDYPPVWFKMNAAELRRQFPEAVSLEQVKCAAVQLAQRNQRPAFVTLAEQGILGVDSDGHVAHVPALPLRGPIDIVGAGDSVTANLAAALAAKASIAEAIELAAVASSIVIHQLGTTGRATVSQIAELAV